ncbi:hypothetical protein N9L86_05995 [Euryarchaeota archaeon]|nr:hypothetical protein [Euryarchaeota archaeon]
MVELWVVNLRSVGIPLVLMKGTAKPEWLDRFRKVRTSNLHKPLIPHSRGTDSKLVADVPVSAPQTQVAQLEATIRSAHALLQAGLIDEAISLLAAFSPEVQPNIDQELTKVRSNLDRTLPNAERW